MKSYNAIKFEANRAQTAERQLGWAELRRAEAGQLVKKEIPWKLRVVLEMREEERKKPPHQPSQPPQAFKQPIIIRSNISI